MPKIRGFSGLVNKMVKKGGSNTGNLTETLMEELNCETVFTLPVVGGISESVVVTWIIMAVLVLLSIILKSQRG